MPFGTQTPDFPDTGCAIVFGGSGGLGAETAGLLASRGCDVVLTYHSNQAKGEAVAAQINDLGRKGTAVKCDVTQRDQVDAALQTALDEHGSIHTVVSAGGLIFRTAPLPDFSAEEFRGVVEADIIGFFNIAQATVPKLRDTKGTITALITCAVDRTVATDALSATPKAAVTMMMRQIATEEAGYGVRSNAVGPAVIDGGMVPPMKENDEATAKLLDMAVEFTPMKRLGTEAEVAEAVVFLASSKASYITGQSLMVDGGLSA